MAVDVSGGVAAELGAPEAAPARASDLSALPDDQLLQELNLGSASEDAANTTDEGDEEGAGALTAAEASDDAAASAGDSEADTGTEGEGEEAAPEETEAPSPAVGFSVFQGADEVEIPADLQIKFTADGAERELPLDRVVRLAQMGFYNEERANEIREFREAMPQIEQSFADLQEQNKILTDGWRRVLSGDEEYLVQEQEQFLRAQSPEARADRAERALYEARQQQQGATVEQHATQFVRSLVPEFETLQKIAPEVSFEEVVGKFNILTAPLMVRGQVPPAKFQEVERIIRSELRPWVEAQHERRMGAKKATTATVTRATAQAAAARKQAARAVLPQGTHPTGAPPAGPKKYAQASDIFSDLDDIVPR